MLQSLHALKKVYKDKKEGHRPFSLLPSFSTVFEGLKMNLWKRNFQNFLLAFGKTTISNTYY